MHTLQEGDEEANPINGKRLLRANKRAHTAVVNKT